MTVHVSALNGNHSDEIVERARALGRLLMDLTGNGPPNRSEKIRQFLGLYKHPHYLIADRTFTSVSDAGLVSATAKYTDPANLGASVLIRTTQAGARTPENANSNDSQFLVRHQVFEMDEDGWDSFTPAEAATMIAKLGRLLVYAPVSQTFTHTDAFSFVLSENHARTRSATQILLAALIENGQVEPFDSLIYSSPTPYAEAQLEFTGSRHSFKKSLIGFVQRFAKPELHFTAVGDRLTVRKNIMSIDASTYSIIDQMKHLNNVRNVLTQAGIDENILKIEDRPDQASA